MKIVPQQILNNPITISTIFKYSMYDSLHFVLEQNTELKYSTNNKNPILIETKL